MQPSLLEKEKFKKLFYENGWVKIQSFFTKSEIKKINEELNLFVKNIAPKLKPGEIHYSEKKINTIHVLDKYSKFFKKLLHSNKVKSLAENILEDIVVPQWAQFFAKPAKEGMAAPPHQDNYYWCIDDANALTVWIALNDSSEQNGGVYYYKKSHKIGFLEHKPSYAPGSSQTIKYPDGIDVFDTDLPNLNAGDCLIHHCLVVHGSKPNKSNHPRIGCTLRYISKNSKIDKFMQYKYNESLDKHFKKLKR